MEQIQQHELIRLYTAPRFSICKHCEVVYDHVIESYVTKEGKQIEEEPACIARYPQQDYCDSSGYCEEYGAITIDTKIVCANCKRPFKNTEQEARKL